MALIDLRTRLKNFPSAHVSPVADKSSALKPLAPDAKTAAIEIQALDLRAATVHENIQRAIEWVTAHRVPRERLKSVVGLAHISGLPVQVHPDLCLGEKHQPCAMLSTIPAPSSRRTSTRDRLDRISPKSINGAATSAAGSARAVTAPLQSTAFSAARHRRNTLAWSADFVCHALGIKPLVNAVLLTDGYAAYTQYAEKTGINHARCWSHGRRTFFDALSAEPTGAAEALEQIKAMYAVEEEIRDAKLAGDAKQLHRLTHSKPLVELFFEWVDRQLQRQGFTPSNPFIQALNYVRERRVGLEVFLTDPDVPIDTNHLERALRVVPMGRKSWLFCWTELGAKHVGIIQSLIVTCRLHGIDPYTYLVDVLQRISEHPDSRVAELTPRLWKQHFAVNPLRSDIHDFPV